MKAKVVIVLNSKAIDEAIEQKGDLGIAIKIPEHEYDEFDFLFDIEDVKFAYMSPKKHILLRVRSEWFEIKFDQTVWDELIRIFE